MLHPEYAAPFWTNFRLVDGKCKLSLLRVFILWIDELSRNNFLLLTTKTSKENKYWDGRGSILSCFNNGRHVSFLPEFVMICIIIF